MTMCADGKNETKNLFMDNGLCHLMPAPFLGSFSADRSACCAVCIELR